jgi:hypothetical protein
MEVWEVNVLLGFCLALSALGWTSAIALLWLALLTNSLQPLQAVASFIFFLSLALISYESARRKV